MARKKATKKSTTRKKATTRKTASKKGKDTLVVGSKVKAALRGSGKTKFYIDATTLEAINELVYQTVEQAQKRCAANNRKTIRPYDVLA